MTARASSSPKAITIRRSLSKEHNRALDRYSKTSGKINWAWAQLHQSFQLLFALLVRGNNLNRDLSPGILIWDSLRNDTLNRRQLAELLTLLKRQQRNDKNKVQIFNNILWAVGWADKLAEYRNQLHVATALHMLGRVDGIG